MTKKRKKLFVVLIIVASLAIIGVSYLLITNWIASLPKLDYAYASDSNPKHQYPNTDFAVISDIHIYDPSLGTTGEAFEAVMQSDRKLLRDGLDLLDLAVDDVLNSNAKFVIITGDLTKDGELVSHNIVTEKLSKLTQAGIKVFVTPGNHDVANPKAESYSGTEATSVETVSADDFKRLYSSFGYADALASDPNSLSYVAEPVSGIWLLSIDSCRYEENQAGESPVVGGSVSQETADWIAGVLNDAVQNNKAVMVMSHHGVVEHWNGQKKLHPDYLINDYIHFSEFLASYDVRLAFTGHYHAQDVVRSDFGDKYIYDVETGSLVTAPCPVRYCTLTDDVLKIESKTFINDVHPGTTFAEEATSFVKATVVLEALDTLEKYWVTGEDADYISNAIGDAFTAHYSGDEIVSDMPEFDSGRLGLWGQIVYFMQKYVFDGMMNDPAPSDNNVSITLD